MLEVVRGDKTIKVPERVLTVAIVAMGVCAVAGDICNTIVKKKK